MVYSTFFICITISGSHESSREKKAIKKQIGILDLLGTKREDAATGAQYITINRNM